MDVKDLMDKVVENLITLQVEMDGFKGSWLNVVKNIPRVIHAVEEVGKTFLLSGADKKALAVAVLDRVVKIKWMPGFIKTAIIEIVIEGIVAAFNLFGHGWLAKVP